ncbi:IS66 family transposase [Aquabacterium sp. A7-Y]|uniref:IS66 family transposase n=1 Tax=Aquabacterium sp. A7-Y TaxID=1349605 RepID=UPI00223E79EB|nr:IS66 family transposase [Aquabacterium sp. A7-Y]MCW7540959.1 IS66 family transposase [Aquabacterium sp. A7-Y]
MLDPHLLKPEDLQGLDAEAAKQLARVMLERIASMTAQINDHAKHLDERDRQIAERDALIKYKDVKLQKLTFELARYKAWKFGAKTEAMTAEQRRLFEETAAEDEADLQAQAEALGAASPPEADAGSQRRPRRQPLPEHLRRVEHHHEPEDTSCPNEGCGRPMVRIGEDVSERLDIVPAEFFVHRHVRGKWACKCCRTLVQEPVAPQVIDKGMPAPGLVAHTMVSRFVDHMPYYRQEAVNARSGVHTPRSTLAAWSGAGAAELQPLFEAHKAFVLACPVLHADETPVAMLDPGAGKTRRTYIWGYAKSEYDPHPGVVYDFCLGRGGKYPMAFLNDWRGTLVCDDYKGYETLFKLPGRTEAGCLVHARRKFNELMRHGHSEVAAEAVRRLAWIFKLEKDARDGSAQDRLTIRQSQTRLHWDELHAWPCSGPGQWSARHGCSRAARWPVSARPS